MERTYETIIVTEDEGVCTIALNRPEVLNALSPKLLDEFIAALHRAATDEAVKAVIITGAGEAFSSGGDVKLDVSLVSTMAPFEFRSYVHTGIVKQIVEMEKPIIAAVNGIATGGALDIALACDIRFASEKARFSEISEEVCGFLDSVGLKASHVVPGSAMKGDNIVFSSDHMSWHSGVTLLGALEAFHVAGDASDLVEGRHVQVHLVLAGV